MRLENKIVSGLWIGNELSSLELLTISSFIENGHHFRLWLYDTITTPLPKGVEVRSASDIIPKEDVFCYTNSNVYGHGKGSYAGFSDIFRYKLLHEFGGWWVDMDVTCLKPLDFEAPYFFRNHHHLEVVGNVMKCPAKSELMLLCYKEAMQTVDENNTDWHKPIEILNRFIETLDLKNYIVENVSNPDKWDITSKYILDRNQIPENWFFIHWQNEEWRFKKVSKTYFYLRSAIFELMKKYHILSSNLSLLERVFNEIKFSKLYRNIFK